MPTPTEFLYDHPSGSVRIRHAVEADLPGLEWDGEYAHLRNVYAQNYQNMQHGNGVIWVAETADARLIGQVFILLISHNKEAADGIHRAYLFSFRIRPEFRNQGLGSVMMNIVETDLLNRGFKILRLNVARNNIEARKLYERLGYHVIGSDHGLWHYQDQFGEWHSVKEPAWRMLKELG